MSLAIQLITLGCLLMTAYFIIAGTIKQNRVLRRQAEQLDDFNALLSKMGTPEYLEALKAFNHKYGNHITWKSKP